MKAVDVLVGRDASNTRRSASAPIASGSGDCTRMPSCTSLRFSRSTSREQIGERGRRRQPLEIGAQAGLARRLQLAADVDLGRRIVADEHDAQAGRPAGPRGERLDRRTELARESDCATAMPSSNRAALIHARPPLRAASANPAGRARPACRRRESRVSGCGLNSMCRSCRWMPTTITPNRCRRLASTQRLVRQRGAGAIVHLLHRELEVVGAGRQRDEIDDGRTQRRLRHLHARRSGTARSRGRRRPASACCIASSVSARPTMKRSGLSTRALSTA